MQYSLYKVYRAFQVACPTRIVHVHNRSVHGQYVGNLKHAVTVNYSLRLSSKNLKLHLTSLTAFQHEPFSVVIIDNASTIHHVNGVVDNDDIWNGYRKIVQSAHSHLSNFLPIMAR